MNELFTAIVKYLKEHEDASAFRTLCVGGVYKHFAPHDIENPYLIVGMDMPESNSPEVMHTRTSQIMYSEIEVKYTMQTKVDLDAGHDQLVVAFEALDLVMDDNTLDMDGYTLADYRVLSAVRQRRFIFPDPEGGWTGHLFIKYQYGNK
jgi:hypothetical protein